MYVKCQNPLVEMKIYLFQEKPVMEWFAKAAGQSVNNLKFNSIAPEEMVS